MATIKIKPMDDVQRALFEAETREEVESALRIGGDVNEIADTRGMSPFHHAIAEGHTGALVAMIERGADLEAPVPSGVSLAEDPAYPKEDYVETPHQEAYKRIEGMRPLDVAVEHSHPDATHELLEAGATIERGRRDVPVLHHALDHFGPSGYDTMEVLLKHGANPNQPNLTKYQETPLHREMPVRTMSLLVDNGADVTLEDSRGRTPLVNAIHSNLQEAASFLIENGADKAQALEHPSIAERGWRKSTIDTLRMVNEADGGRNRVATYHVDRIDGNGVKPDKHNAEIQALLDTPYESSEPYVPSQEARDHSKRLILDSVKRRDLGTIDREVETMGKDILNETYPNGQSLLGAAAWSDYKASDSPPLLPRLLQRGVDPNVCNHEGTPALVELSGYRTTESIKPLLDAGVDANAMDPKTGRTALFEACMVGQSSKAEMVRMLLDHGGRHDVVDHEGNTPLAIAAMHSSPVVAETLMKRGADVKVAMQCPVWKEAEALPPTQRSHQQNTAMALVHKTAVEQEKQALRQAAAEVEQAQPAHEKPAARVRMRM